MRELVNQDIYQHASRPEWGGAIIAWERDGKRGYQFEDGQVRVFTVGHYHRLERINGTVERFRTLRALLGEPGDAPATSALSGTRELPSHDEQIEYFLAAYPGGFGGAKWQADHRGGPDRARKRHRDPAVALARKDLTAAYLTGCLERRRDQEALETLATVLGQTDLVAPAEVQRLRTLLASRARAVVVGLFELLFGRASVEVRMVQWVEALAHGTGRRPGWAMATTPLALLYPDQHICINRRSFAAQALSMEARPRVAAFPSGADYPRLLAMAERIRAHLTARSCAPADLLDLHDFMVFTTREHLARSGATPGAGERDTVDTGERDTVDTGDMGHMGAVPGEL